MLKRLVGIIMIGLVASLVSSPLAVYADCEINDTGSGSTNTCTETETNNTDIDCDNTTTIDIDNDQDADSGNVNQDDNTNVGDGSSGDASNDADIDLSSEQSCEFSQSSVQNPPSGNGGDDGDAEGRGGQVLSAATVGRGGIKSLPNTGVSSALSGLSVYGAATAGLSALSMAGAAMYRRFSL